MRNGEGSIDKGDENEDNNGHCLVWNGLSRLTVINGEWGALGDD